MTEAQRLIDEATRWIGVREKGGANCGPEVEEFQRSVDDRADGAPWCMSFVQFCVKRVSDIIGKKPSLYPSEHCLTVWNRTPEELRLSRPVPGCVVIWRKSGTDQGHTGIVVSVGETKMITIEGNTGPASIVSREGDGVYEKERAIHPVTGRMEVVGYLRAWRLDS